jgi:hypothetical protein
MLGSSLLSLRPLGLAADGDTTTFQKTERVPIASAMKHAALLWAFVLLCIAPRPGFAHDKWIEAEPFTSPTPQATKIYLATGEALQQSELLPLRRASSVRRFQVVSSAGTQDLRGVLREDQQPIAVAPVEMIRPGTSVIVVDTAPTGAILAFPEGARAGRRQAG